MCRLFAISTAKKENLKTDVNALLVHFGMSNEDGTGFAFTKNDKIVVKKSADKAINFVLRNHYEIKSDAVIGHVRLATGSEVIDKNAHPFLAEDGSFALAHNGIITGYHDLKKELSVKHEIGEVDSEILLHAFEEQKEGFIKFLTSKKVNGSANIVILGKDGSVYVYSDGEIYYKTEADRVIVIQEKLFKGMKKLRKGSLMTIKNGKVVSIKAIGEMSAYVWISKETSSFGNISFGKNYEGYKVVYKRDETGEIESLIEDTFGLNYANINVTKRNSHFVISIRRLPKEKTKIMQMVFPNCVVTERSYDECDNLTLVIKAKKLKRRIKYFQNQLDLPLLRDKDDWEIEEQEYLN